MYRRIIFLFFIISSLAGCSHYTSKDVSQKKDVEQKKEAVLYSFGLEVFSENALSETQETHLVTLGGEYKPDIKVTNDMPINSSYRLVFLLNYKQISVNYRGKPVRSIDLKLNSYENRKIDVEFPKLESGSYDIIALLIRNPDEITKQKKFQPSQEFYLYRRVQLVVGAGEERNQTYKLVDNTLEKKNNIDGVFLTNKFNGTSQDLLLNMRTNEKEKQYLNIPNYNDSSRYAIFAFIGDEQVNLDSSFVEIKRKGPSSVPLEFITRKEGNLVIGVVANPYINVENQNEKENKLSTDVMFSNRIPIHN
ncbi:hypothetical protein IAE22_24670 [Bacillus sp. S34]|nr:hypothetical protein [Bacillus sp. S34]